jgi:hypothetical protein
MAYQLRVLHPRCRITSQSNHPHILAREVTMLANSSAITQPLNPCPWSHIPPNPISPGFSATHSPLRARILPMADTCAVGAYLGRNRAAEGGRLPKAWPFSARPIGSEDPPDRVVLWLCLRAHTQLLGNSTPVSHGVSAMSPGGLLKIAARVR